MNRVQQLGTVCLLLLFAGLLTSHSQYKAKDPAGLQIRKLLPGRSANAPAADIAEQATATSDAAPSFAYVLYATTEAYLCNSIVNVRRLIALNVTTEADVVVMYPDTWDSAPSEAVKTMFSKLRELKVKLAPVQIVMQRGEPTWAESLTKLKIFTLTQYERILYFDVDGLVQRNMNHLFRLPHTPVAMPRAYWLDQPMASDQLAVIEPLAERLEELLDQAKATGGFDMDVMNDLYKGMALILPNEFDFLTGELRKTDHAAYLGNKRVQWNATAELDKAYYVHFSDWPTPKPWVATSSDVNMSAPKCPPGCTERELWISLYTRFQSEMQVCK